MLRFAEVDAACAEALGNAYKAKRCPPNGGSKRRGVSLSSLKRAAADEDITHSLQSTPRNGVCTVSTGEKAVELAQVYASTLPGSQPRIGFSDQQSHSSPSMPFEAFASRSSGFNMEISSDDVQAKPNPENLVCRPKHSATPTGVAGVLGRLDVLLSDTVVNEDGTFSARWLPSANELLRICEDIFQKSGESSTDSPRMRTIEAEIKGAASLLQFIKDVKGNECELLMKKYSSMAHRLSECIKKLAAQELPSKTGADYSSDFPNQLRSVPNAATEENEGFRTTGSGMAGSNEFNKPYMGLPCNVMVSNPYTYTQPCLNTPSMLGIRPSPYGNVLPIPTAVMPQCPPYLCGPAPTLMQDGAPVQAVMRHPQCSPMHNMIPRYAPLYGCSYEEKYYTPTLMNTHVPDKVLVAGPWNAQPGEMASQLNYPNGCNPIIDSLGGMPRIQ
ncbi:UDP-N-acetylenolpyruvoylglucosamine reductase, putative [Babesia ovata]|uniref:UDP-N-acetylenolpyruvoylglucosamine reductase, putative n=1 Tax=Babesia ovata TaxID=189622 RepID=A0A2H6KGM7_9APIC|nr:UDP-N-acetylenolpyruvoylglucosamine reductase, putative [Babesia ovata]GBE62127.1 UDP-N-acetylenolpyruvoylglucosamine reductase, putative [Babesia ovata]